MSLEINDLNKSFGSEQVLKDFNLDMDPGEIVQVEGETGRGKTTLKRCISGLEEYEKGKVDVNGDIAHVFQDERVLPWLNVKKNILLSLQLKNEEITEDKLDQMIELARRLGVDDHLDKKIDQVSGGQLQRLLLIRALITGPSVLLLDEPFNSLDSSTRNRIYSEVLEICKEKGIAVLVASHNEDLDSFVDRKISL